MIGQWSFSDTVQFGVLHLPPAQACNTLQNNVLCTVSKTSSATHNPSLRSIVLNFMTERLTVWALLLMKKIEFSFLKKSLPEPCTKQDAVLVHLSYLQSQKDTHPHCPLATICLHSENAKIQRPEHTGRHLPWTDCFHRNTVVQKYDRHIIIMGQSR